MTVGGIETRATWSNGRGDPTVLLHGWMDNADTWLEVLDLLAARELPAIAYDQPGFGVAPPLDGGSVLDQLVDFAARAVLHAAEQSGGPVIVAGNSLGGWTALRLAEHDDLPIAGVVAMAPAGVRMAPLFFTDGRDPGGLAPDLAAGAGARGRGAVGSGRRLPAAGVRRPGVHRPVDHRPLHPVHGRPRRDPDQDRLRKAGPR